LTFAFVTPAIGGVVGAGLLHGLKIVAVAIVAQAVWGMARNLCPDRERSTIALAAVAAMAFVPGSIGMLGAIVLGAVAGLVFCRGEIKPVGNRVAVPVSRWMGGLSLLLFLALLVVFPLLAEQSQALAVVDRFYRAGALVFGGGHVVLPLLDAEVVRGGWVTHDAFLAGYGIAQAVPGPLFTFAAYLGAVLGLEPNGILGAGLALLAIFLPGFLVLVGALPFWDQFRSKSLAQSLMRGANAAVVGILGAALYSPVFTSAVADLRDLLLALAGFLALIVWKAPPWLVVVLSALCGVGLALLA
jgi:chromate transporter